MADISPFRTLGEQESRLLSSLAAAGYTLFTIEQARSALPLDDAALRKLLHRLHYKGWLKRLERGKYLLIPLEAGPDAQWAEHEYLIAASLTAPYYLAYATPLHYYGYSDLPLDPVTVAVIRRKRPVTINNLTYRFITVKPHKFFGYQPISLLGHTIQMAEREKAVADAFDRSDLVRGVLEAAKSLYFGKTELDWNKVVAYSLKLDNQTAQRRLGFWLELLGLGDEQQWSRLESQSGHGYAPLEPAGSTTGTPNTRWRLTINIPERQLLEWQEH
jgi:predicted transcriptional regulator of viral defense system